MQNIPRPEYPRPQLVRSQWINLNGEWQFEVDNGESGRSRELPQATALSHQISVPFCPESKLSGIENTDFMRCVWYTRSCKLPEDWQNGLTILHFGACDYGTEVWVNGESVGKHKGGYSSFSFDITAFLQKGENRITVCAQDDTRNPAQPTGKQSDNYHSYGCFYTRTTGIWQTVWLECVPKTYITSLRYTPLLEESSLLVEATCQNAHGKTITAKASFQGEFAGEASAVIAGKTARFLLPLSVLHLWEPGSPALYDLQLSLCEDLVSSYFGMRSVAVENEKLLLNGKVIFQRLILDQGFYPDGIYTAPSDAELEKDILRSLEMGFNGARLHEKIFEPRFLYHCDRLGYLVWGEFPNWGLDLSLPQAWGALLPEWLAAVSRDYNHPAIIGWCPLNETNADQDPDLVKAVVSITRAADHTRPVIDASGWYHVENLSDMLCAHDYEQDPAVFRARYDQLLQREAVTCPHSGISAHYTFISEYGGIWWSETDSEGWGYGERPQSFAHWLERYRGLTEALLQNPKIYGFCYTQLTDVEQEQNGLYTYHRQPKVDPAVLAAINRQTAAVEKMP